MGRRLACARRGSRAEQKQLVIPANTSPFSEFARPWASAAGGPRAKLQASGLRLSPSLSFSPSPFTIASRVGRPRLSRCLVFASASGLGHQNALCRPQEGDTELGCVYASLSCAFVPRPRSTCFYVVRTLFVSCAVCGLVFSLSVGSAVVYGPFGCRVNTFSVQPSRWYSPGCGATFTPAALRLAVQPCHCATACRTQSLSSSRAR